VPIHWNGEYASGGLVNVLVNPATDPMSGQPESKHMPISGVMGFPDVQAYAGEWSLRWMSDRRTGATGHACSSAPNMQKSSWIAYRDPSIGRYRYASIRDGRLEGCIFIARGHKLVSRSWLTSLFDSSWSKSGGA
jgi:assimilatory nitrate reductase catalytic subunit